MKINHKPLLYPDPDNEKITRIDFFYIFPELSSHPGWQVRKFIERGNTAILPEQLTGGERKICIPDPLFDIEAALTWCRSHRYEVIEWDYPQFQQKGARAWLGGKRPVRDRYDIRVLRYNKNVPQNMDLAFEGFLLYGSR